MKNTAPLLCLLAMVAACNDEPQPPAPPPAPEVCGYFKAAGIAGKSYPGFDISPVKIAPPDNMDGNKLILAKKIKATDGQVIGYEKHTLQFDNKIVVCKFTELSAEREVRGDRLVNIFSEKRSEFYQKAQLIYTDRALKDGAWIRRYAQFTSVPVEVPNWATKDHSDIYMTWVARSGEQASRVPVWGMDVIWVGPVEDPTILAGKVIYKNPKAAPVTSDLVTVMRFDSEGVVNVRGILFPVSTKTFEAYLANMEGKSPEWQRDSTGDEEALTAFTQMTSAKGSSWRKHATRAVGEVYRLRATQVAALPKVAPAFVPAFSAVPPLVR